MKKVALLLLIAFVGSSVMFAVPAVNAVSEGAADEADLFAAVGGEELSAEESDEVEGEGYDTSHYLSDGRGGTHRLPHSPDLSAAGNLVAEKIVMSAGLAVLAKVAPVTAIVIGFFTSF